MFLFAVFGFVLPLANAQNVIERASDEGLERITKLGDRDLVAQANKARKKFDQPQYKSVEDQAEQEAEQAAKSPLFPQKQTTFFGAGLDFFDNFGLQFRYSYRLIDQGILSKITNPISIEGGFGTTFYGTKRGQTGVTGFDALLTARWDLQFDENWTLFLDLGAGYNGVSNDRQADVKGGGWFPAIGFGVIASITTDWAIRADCSYQFVGLGILHRF